MVLPAQGQETPRVVPCVSRGRGLIRAKASNRREEEAGSTGTVGSPGRDGRARQEPVMVMTLPESDAEFAPPPEAPPDPSGPPIPLTRPTIADDAVAAAAAVVRTGWMAEGPAVAAFEEAFADLVR